MLAIRSSLFNACFILFTVLFSLLVILFRPLGFSASWFWARAWSNMTFLLLKLICGIRIVIEGAEHLPEHACVVIAKHQSAAEAVAMPFLVPPYTWVLKRELFQIPFFGWALAIMGAIGIRRGNPREALKQVMTDGSERLSRGLWVVIFPEGTRSEVGSSGHYQPGGIVLAQKAGVGILPMAHNAGTCWAKRSFIKTPGTITFRFLPYIPAETVSDTKRALLMQQLEHDIEAATRELGG